MLLDDPACDRETQPSSAGRASTGLINTVETLEDLRLFRRWDSDAVVPNAYNSLLCEFFQGDINQSGCGGIFNGIVEQGVQRPSQGRDARLR